MWLASWVGGATVVGGVAKAYEFGVSGSWYTICMAIGCLTFGLFFAARVKRWGTERDLLTYPDLMESVYDSRTRIVSTITTIFRVSLAFAAGQLAAAGAILSTLLGWDYSTSLLLASAIIVVYTATGGFLAVTYTDWVQFALLFIGIVHRRYPYCDRQWWYLGRR